MRRYKVVYIHAKEFLVGNHIESEQHTSECEYKKDKDFSRDNPTSGGTDFQPASWKPNS